MKVNCKGTKTNSSVTLYNSSIEFQRHSSIQKCDVVTKIKILLLGNISHLSFNVFDTFLPGLLSINNNSIHIFTKYFGYSNVVSKEDKKNPNASSCMKLFTTCLTLLLRQQKIVASCENRTHAFAFLDRRSSH